MTSTNAPVIRAGHCPKCGSDSYQVPKMTWWGGVIGPKVFHHAVCNTCKTGFNENTGKPNAVRIAFYVTISLVVVLAVIIYTSGGIK